MKQKGMIAVSYTHLDVYKRQATTAPTINYNGSGVTTYNLVPAAQ